MNPEDILDQAAGLDPQEILDQVTQIGLDYGPKILGAIIVWVIGSWIVNIIVSAFGKAMVKTKTDASLQPFLKGLAGSLLKVMLVITVLGMLGIEMTSFIAILGAAGLAVGMALSGTLQNFAGGVMILIFKPFKIGDVIDAQGFVGAVQEIQIFNTILKTPDNKTIIIPNAGLSSGSMTNFSTEATRRVDWTISVGYGDDLDKAKAVIKRLCDEDSRILKNPEAFIAVAELADSSVNFTVRAWVNAADFWGVYFAMNENVYKTFPKEGLNIPYPQMDIHMHKEANNK
ncbi:MAG: mechanosensitive ion channel [Methyloprofundus sp.]|nr:mechanosensitive ion channel [Methyloprofundus sp.]MBW6452642.1 mechanosensitive ion channel [Methyloprofundus sp.]